MSGTITTAHLVVERRLHRIEVVRSDGDQRSATTNVEVQLVLKIKEARGERAARDALVVDIVSHMNVPENSARHIGTDHLRA